MSPTITPEKFSFLKKQLAKKIKTEPDDHVDGLWQAPLNLMSTNPVDYTLVNRLQYEFPKFIIANYGVHPWFAHLFTLTEFDKCLSNDEIKRLHYGDVLSPRGLDKELFDALPLPIFLPTYVEDIRSCMRCDAGAGVGEIGIDKSFRIPMCGYLGARQAELFGSPRCGGWLPEDNECKVAQVKLPGNDGLSQFRTTMAHQVAVMVEFLRLAKMENRSVSIHCVGSHGKLCDILRQEMGDYDSERIALHSYSGSVEQIRTFKHYFPRIRFSLSRVINLDRNRDTIRRALQQRYLELCDVLLESDLGLDELYAEKLDSRYEKLVSDNVAPLDRHTHLLAYTASEIVKMNPDFTLEELDSNYEGYTAS